MNHRTLIAALVAASLVAASLVGCKQSDEGDKEPAPVVNAATVVVSAQAFTETFDAIGNVVPRSDHVATLSAPGPGRVASVSVTTGQAVDAGETLVTLDQAPFESALRAAEAAVAAAERANDREQRLANEGIAPRKDAEAAAADAAAKRADLVNAQRMAALSVLKAPIAGVVTKMNATIGASVDASQPLVEIADPRALDILLNATPTDAGRTQPGAKVALSAGSTAKGEPLGVATVVDVSGTVDSTQRGVAIRAHAATTRRPLKIGETVFGQVAVATRPNAIVIPNDALVPDGEKFKVFVVDNQGIAHERDVTVGGKSDAGVEITEGLTVGERIVTQGAYAVSDSAKVAPLSAPPGKVPDEEGGAAEKGDAKDEAPAKEPAAKEPAAKEPAAKEPAAKEPAAAATKAPTKAASSKP
jgi:RND family efflux transporter MFP subunit